MSADRLIAAFLNRTNGDPMYACLRSQASPADWRAALLAICDAAKAQPDLTEHLHTCWITHGAGIRHRVGDDAALARALRGMLPPYTGEARRLFRGESTQWHAENRIGFCWTPARRTAEMFARGLNAAHEGGGVLLSAFVPMECVIAGPGQHSNWLGEAEYTIDPATLTNADVLARYPRSA